MATRRMNNILLASNTVASNASLTVLSVNHHPRSVLRTMASNSHRPRIVHRKHLVFALFSQLHQSDHASQRVMPRRELAVMMVSAHS